MAEFQVNSNEGTTAIVETAAPSTFEVQSNSTTVVIDTSKGEKGDKGDQGIQGVKGDTGPANTLAIGTVTTGAAGSPAAANITGAAPNQTLDLTIPKGDKGDQGIQGVKGDPGQIQSVQAGTNITVNNTDPANPIVSATAKPLNIEDEGVSLTTQPNTLNFTGAGVTATVDASDNVTVQVDAVPPPDASTTTKGLIQLAGDLGGTAAAPTVTKVYTKADVGLGNVTNDAQLKAAQLDTDGTLAGNSDAKVASQKATKTYVDSKGTISLIKNEAPTPATDGTTTAFSVATPNYATGSLRVYLNGQRLKSGASNDYVETTTGFTMNYAPASTDVLLVDYDTSNGQFVQGSNSEITDESVQETPDGSRVTFTCQRGYLANSLEVFINGLRQDRGVHVTETNPSVGSFTLDTAPLSGQIVRVNYQFATGASGNSDTVDGNHSEDMAPVGAGMDYYGSALPSSKWVWADGRALSRTDYPTLFARLGTTFGAGDGSTTFNIPDKRGRVTAAADAMGGTAANRLGSGQTGGITGVATLGAAGGEQGHTQTSAEMPNHRHYITIGAGSAGVPEWINDDTSSPLRNYPSPSGTNSRHQNGYTDYTGSGNTMNNLQPTLVCNYIIKVL